MRDGTTDVELRVAIKAELRIDHADPLLCAQPASGEIVAVQQARAVLEVAAARRGNQRAILGITSKGLGDGRETGLVGLELEAVLDAEWNLEDVRVVQRAHRAVRERRVRLGARAVMQGTQVDRELVQVMRRQPLAAVHGRAIVGGAEILEHQYPRVRVPRQQARHLVRDRGNGAHASIEASLEVRTLGRRGDVVIALHPWARLLHDETSRRCHHPQREIHVAGAGAATGEDLLVAGEPAAGDQEPAQRRNVARDRARESRDELG